MHVFSSSIHVEARQPLGGFGIERLSLASSNQLEINGLSFNDVASGKNIELCTLDTLYSGDLLDGEVDPDVHRIFAASHTHFAPMLDSSKPQLGAVSDQALKAWRNALRVAPRKLISPTQCRIWRAEVSLPIYRRFDVPATKLNRWLTEHCGMFPNESQPIDQSLYIFEFGDEIQTDAVIIFHACHPVSRTSQNSISADYIDALRRAARAKFGEIPCLFLLGCCGDVRPNLAEKRVDWLPRSRLNWRFVRAASLENELSVDAIYSKSVAESVCWQSINLMHNELRFESIDLELINQPSIQIPVIYFGDSLRFEFIPFEVSHLFHLDAQKKDPMRFIVSCANRTIGYLPHPTQIKYGGYEVDASRVCMGLSERVLLKHGRLW